MNNLDAIYNKNGLDPIKFSEAYTNYLISLLKKLDHKKIAKCIDLMEESRVNDNTIFLAGNGGSASTASHIGNDFGLAVLKKSKNKNTKSYRALPLTDNMSIVTATANDSTYRNIFLDQLKVHFRPGDKLILISASGNSPNLVEAAKWFNENGGITIGWLGFDGGELHNLVNTSILVESPKGEYAPVEDIHLVINHIIVSWMQFNIIELNDK